MRWNDHGPWLSCLLVSATLSSAAFGAGLLGVPAADAGTDRRDQAVLEGIIREGYARLSALTATGGTPLRFELTEFQLYTRSQLPAVRLTELADLPGGDSINTTRSEQFEGADLRVLKYVAEWTSRERNSEDETEILLLNAEQGLLLAAEDDPALLGVTSVLTFKVAVHLQGRVREYRACAWWIDDDPRSEQLRLILNDNVVSGVAEAFSEFDRFKTFEQSRYQTGLNGADGVRLSGPVPGLLGGSDNQDDKAILSCNPETFDTASKWASKFASDGHTGDGNHGVLVTASFDCDCTAGCGQSCRPSGTTYCQERGARVTGEKCHDISLSSSRSQFNSSANTNGIQCAEAGACGLKKCNLCLCAAATVTIVFSGVEASFTTESGTVAYGAASSYACPTCTVSQPPPPPPPPPDDPYDPIGPPDSPLLLDFGKPGFRLTSLSQGVQFDLTGDGLREQVSWTTGEDALLVLDRNKNGLIDGALEVFGNHTEQPDSSEKNGFLALAVFDGAHGGGNADGSITSADRVFSSLRLWFDRNHDGTSQPSELEPLGPRGVIRLELEYVESRRTDRWGNEFRYLAWYHSEQGPRKMVQDVFFVVGPSEVGP